MTATVFDREGDDEAIATVFTPYSSDSEVRAIRDSGRGKSGDWFKDGMVTVIGNTGSRWNVGSSGVCLGLTNSVGQGEGGLQWSKSIEISWLSCINVCYSFSRSQISLGLGFDWRNYKTTTSDRCLVATPDRGIAWGKYPEGTKARYSRLKVFSLQFPLLYRWRVPKSSLAIQLGPVLNFNTYASLLTVYDDIDGNRAKDFTKALSPRRVTLDFFGSLSFCNAVGLYVRYSPMKVMNAPQSLNFHPLTVGFTLGI